MNVAMMLNRKKPIIYHGIFAFTFLSSLAVVLLESSFSPSLVFNLEKANATNTINIILIILNMVDIATTSELTKVAEPITWPTDCKVPPIIAEVCIVSFP